MTLPVPGADFGIWGPILNEFLLVSLNADGTINPTALAVDGDVDITTGVSVLIQTSNVEAIVRNQSPNQLALMTGTLNANAQAISNQATVGAVLAQKVYVPATPTAVSTSSTSLAAVDSTNLTTPSFQATTTQVTVELSAAGAVLTGSGEYYWTVVEHSGTTPLAIPTQVSIPGGAATTAQQTIKLYVGSLTVGNMYQFDWAHCIRGSNTSVIEYGGVTTIPIPAEQYCAAVMTVKVA